MPPANTPQPIHDSASEHNGALDLRDALRRREVGARELTQAHLARISARSELGAFISVNAEIALREADLSDHRIAAARDDARAALPPLLGVPTAHKDLVNVRGVVTTHGSRAVPHLVADADDPIAAKLRGTGAVSLGKTQVPEFGIAGYSENEISPPAANPFDATRTAGGSSGGSAAAVAAGLIPAAIGSDAGGSIRIPAAACGLVGLKPGRGVIPVDAKEGPLDPVGAPRMGVSGPIARTATDAALLFDAVMGAGQVGAGHTGSRPGAEPSVLAVARAENLRGLRIGVSLASPFESWIPIEYSTDALAALDAAILRLQDAGHAVEETSFSYDPRYPELFTTVWTAGLARIRFAPGAEARLGPLARMFLDRSRLASPSRIGGAASGLREFARQAVRQWGAYDAVLTPALAFAPPAIGAFRARGPEGDYRVQCEWAPQTSMVNVAGLPAITAPTWRTETGMPMGVQLIGRWGDEARLLQLAAQLTS